MIKLLCLLMGSDSTATFKKNEMNPSKSLVR